MGGHARIYRQICPRASHTHAHRPFWPLVSTMLSQLLTYASTLGAAWLLYGLVSLIRHRLMIKNVVWLAIQQETSQITNPLSQPKPPWSPIYGHLKLMADAMALFPENMHPHVIFTYLHKKYN